MNGQQGDGREHTRGPGWKPPLRVGLAGVRVARGRNRLLKPCPVCEAPRYTKCYKWQGASNVRLKEGEQDLAAYLKPTLMILDTPHEQRYGSLNMLDTEPEQA